MVSLQETADDIHNKENTYEKPHKVDKILQIHCSYAMNL